MRKNGYEPVRVDEEDRHSEPPGSPHSSHALSELGDLEDQEEHLLPSEYNDSQEKLPPRPVTLRDKILHPSLTLRVILCLLAAFLGLTIYFAFRTHPQPQPSEGTNRGSYTRGDYSLDPDWDFDAPRARREYRRCTG